MSLHRELVIKNRDVTREQEVGLGTLDRYPGIFNVGGVTSVKGGGRRRDDPGLRVLSMLLA